MTDLLSDRDRVILAFESRRPGHSSAKEEAIRAELQLTPARYYQLLDRVIDTEPALAAGSAAGASAAPHPGRGGARRAERTAASAG